MSDGGFRSGDDAAATLGPGKAPCTAGINPGLIRIVNVLILLSRYNYGTIKSDFIYIKYYFFGKIKNEGFTAGHPGSDDLPLSTPGRLTMGSTMPQISG
jgi:hypothetical protein